MNRLLCGGRSGASVARRAGRLPDQFPSPVLTRLAILADFLAFQSSLNRPSDIAIFHYRRVCMGSHLHLKHFIVFQACIEPHISACRNDLIQLLLVLAERMFNLLSYEILYICTHLTETTDSRRANKYRLSERERVVRNRRPDSAVGFAPIK